MRVFVTGISGFLGSHIAEVLLERGHDVIALARNPSAVDADLQRWTGPGARPDSTPPPEALLQKERRGGLTLVQGSLTSAAVLENAVSRSDAIVHVAGLIQARSEAEYMRVNRDGVDAVLRAVAQRSSGLKRFVLISSQAAAGPAHTDRALTESDSPRPVSSYGRSKLAGERCALDRAGDIPITILRPPVVFGPRDRMLARIFRAVARGQAAVWGNGSNAFNAVYAPDVARAARLALEVDHPTGTVLYTGDDRPFTWRSFIETLGAVASRRVRILRVPPPVFFVIATASTALAFASGRPPLLSFDKLFELREPRWLCTSRAARDVLGWSPSVRVEEALEATYGWYRSRGLA